MKAQELTQALGGRWHGRYGMACCPAHDDRTPSLCLADGEDRTLLHCHGGCDQQAVMAALRERGLWGNTGPSLYNTSREPDFQARQNAQIEASRQAVDTWTEAKPVQDGDPVMRYLGTRGIIPTFPVPSIRYQAALKYTHSNIHLPAMVCAVQAPDREVVAIHRTYLCPSGKGKAQVSQPRLALGPISRGAVRLACARESLILVEGVEDALSLQQMTGQPCWALLGTAGFKNVVLPEGARTVILASDADRAGDAAANDGAGRLAGMGLTVLRLRPPEGRDWNDVLLDFEERIAIRENEGGDTDARLAAFAETIGGRYE